MLACSLSDNANSSTLGNAYLFNSGNAYQSTSGNAYRFASGNAYPSTSGNVYPFIREYELIHLENLDFVIYALYHSKTETYLV